MSTSRKKPARTGRGPFQLTTLPWSYRALAPVISESTLRTHHLKHHATYVKKANLLARKAGLADQTPEQVIRRARSTKSLATLYSNAAQAWNHDFYWSSLAPRSQRPAGELRVALVSGFGSLGALVSALVEAGTTQFGSGWVWLVRDARGRLAVESTDNADSPQFSASHCLLTFDVWEHAYYLDYRQDRKAHLKAVISQHANWAFAQSRFQPL